MSTTARCLKISTASDSPLEYHLSTWMRSLPGGQFGGSAAKSPCPHAAWGTVQPASTVELHWNIPSDDPFDDDGNNVTFRLQYKDPQSRSLFEVHYNYNILRECQLQLRGPVGNLSSYDLPRSRKDCQVIFPGQTSAGVGNHLPLQRHGLVVELTRLNVPCSKGGYLQFSAGDSDNFRSYLPHAHPRHKHLCGKLEELQYAERSLYFPGHKGTFLHVHESPVFSLKFRLVDYCFNVTLTNRNGSVHLMPSDTLLCTFKIHLPYGNRVSLKLQMGDSNNHEAAALGDVQDMETAFTHSRRTPADPDPFCIGLSATLWDGQMSWTQCLQKGDSPRTVQYISKGNTLLVRVVVQRDNTDIGIYTKAIRKEPSDYNIFSDVQLTDDNYLSDFSDSVVKSQFYRDRSGEDVSVDSDDLFGENSLYLKFWYEADPVFEIVQECTFGWVAVEQFCVSAVEDVRLPWLQAETECSKRGSHLASVRSERAQLIVDNLLLNSPGYRDHNAYWIGASDKSFEGDFRWSDGLPFTYSNWFPGWSQHGHYNKQPNDDGLSGQDCVEMRRSFHHPVSAATKSARLSLSYMWNDRDCSTPNYFLCERPISDEPVDGGWPSECNRTLSLTPDSPKAALTSPAFPRQYPDNANCLTVVTAPSGYRIVLDFEELVLENESHCSYDYLEIIEPPSANATSAPPTGGGVPPGDGSSRRLCGDWSSKLKLLRYVSAGARLTLRFVSDYSHHYGGYKARMSMENAAAECADDRLQMFNHSCYLFVSYPEVTWRTAQQVCRGIKAQLASVQTPEEERFITTNIRSHPEYSTSAIYWLGGEFSTAEKVEWTDGADMTYLGWLPGQSPEEREVMDTSEPICLGVHWMTSPTPMLPSGLYWDSQRCSHVGGYVCKRQGQISGTILNLNRTVNGTEGRLISPNYPGNYYHNLDYWVKIVGPERTRLVIQFSRIDLEAQNECLYDYVRVRSIIRGTEIGGARWCGTYETDMAQFDFVSESNEAILQFHSDYSISGSGFSMTWQAVDVSGCPLQTLTAREGVVISPNYPHFLLARLDCAITILAPAGRKVWLEIVDYDFGDTDLFGHKSDLQYSATPSEATLNVNLGGSLRPFQPYQLQGHLSDGAYLSTTERLYIKLRTGDRPRGAGFRAIYKTVNVLSEERVLDISNVSTGMLLHLNYPAPPPPGIDYSQHLIVPLGNVILIEMHGAAFSDGGCGAGLGSIEIHDSYADSNGTAWYLCEDTDAADLMIFPAPIAVTSYLNTLHVRQRGGSIGVHLNATVRVQPDLNYKAKLLRADIYAVESCTPDPCQHGGKCVSNGNKRSCQCYGHFTGMLCALNLCELEPCLFGQCELTSSGYRCHCQPGYVGPTCERKQRPCADNPCEGRGECLERGDNFHCRCHAWWEGQRCERKMMHIPFKPLSERMLQEPFWLGLITVFVVLGVIGLVWCAKRHFPEKIEKLLADEADRNRGPITSSRGSSMREQLAVGVPSSVLVGSTVSTPGGAPRSLFGRLGIRKPSLIGLGLTSPHDPRSSPAARTFSLDDLLKPPPRRSPSPRKKRNNSTPTKKNAAEKKQILQQLMAPAAIQTRSKISLEELIQLSEAKVKKNNEKLAAESIESVMKETTFSGGEASGSASTSTRQLTDYKLEKKVTFARLLNKVSAEMSSGSDIELGNLACLYPRVTETVKAVSVPASPSLGDMHSPHSTSSNQGSDSLSSSEQALSAPDILINNSRSLPSGRTTKLSSADSILAMFKNFSSSTACTNLASSVVYSPSTTPTASSPQDDAAGDDDSSTSSMHTPVSFSSAPDSPLFYRKAYTNTNIIKVPVLDTLSAQKNNTHGNHMLQPPTILLEIPSNNNKCLSPIRELPTPLPTPIPSPALTPIMGRNQMYHSSNLNNLRMNIIDDYVTVEVPCISQNQSEDEDDNCFTTHNVVVDLHAEAGLFFDDPPLRIETSPNILEYPIKSKGSLHEQDNTMSIHLSDSPAQPQYLQNTSCIKSPSTRNIPPHSLVIPTLTVQQPSPTRQIPSMFIFPGSPPPQRARASIGETSSLFPNKQQQRKLLKEFDKPTSLDLPFAPPLITITCNMSEAESDAESMSPANKSANLLMPSSSNVGMCYLSPFSMCTRGDRTTSESNLSSSGYSSMASPGASRCGSSNPLCPSEMEDPGSGHGSNGLNAHQLLARRHSPLLMKTTTNIYSDRNVDVAPGDRVHCRGRSDSETLSDDPLLESNDEGIGTDHLDEKIEEGELKSAKELEVFIVKDFLDNGKTILGMPILPMLLRPPSIEKCIDRILPQTPVVAMASLQLPSIVIQPDLTGCDKHLSPVSSRSESPLSDRTAGLGRFSPLFYGRNNKDQLPFTDSDGLYDFPSSDCPPSNSRANAGAAIQHHRKSTGRRRERKSSRPLTTSSKTPSPTKLPSVLLDIPGKETCHRHCSPRKPSPKRRTRTHQPISPSSSSESLASSTREVSVRIASDGKSSPSPEGTRWAVTEWPETKVVRSAEASGEETGEDIARSQLPTTIILDDFSRPHRKVSRLKAIGNQIRFLRRLELSLKRRERVVSPTESIESGNDGEDSPKVTSPLLPLANGPRPEIRKMASGLGVSCPPKSRMNRGVRFKKPSEQSLLGHEERSIVWNRATGECSD